MEYDERFMQEALLLAGQAMEAGEVPVGALIVSPQGEILGRGYNGVEASKSQVEHAEVRAIQMACQKQNDWRLDGCTLYVTLEPCMMCISLVALSRIERVVFGAESPLFGFHLDKEGVLTLYTKRIKNITAGVLADEAAQLLRQFFQKKRMVI